MTKRTLGVAFVCLFSCFAAAVALRPERPGAVSDDPAAILHNPRLITPGISLVAPVDAGVDALHEAERIHRQWQIDGTATPDEKTLMARHVLPRGIARQYNPLDAEGGPDTFGYRYVDNTGGDTATFNWIELCGDPAAADGPQGDDVQGTFAWSWDFPFYGENYSSASVSTNGTISFGTAFQSFSNICPYTTFATCSQIAPYWDDLLAATAGGCTNDGASPWIRWRDFGDYAVVEWSRVGHYPGPTSDRFSFQVILYPDGKIKFQYGTDWNDATTPSSASIGIAHTDPSFGLEYRCNSTGNAQISGGRAVWFYQETTISGRCCYGSNPSLPRCVDTTPEDCEYLSGTWTTGITCASDPCFATRPCDVMTPADAVLDPVPSTPWAGSVAGNCGNGGKWVGSFTAQAGAQYHFDLCHLAPGDGQSNFDADIKIVNSTGTILSGADGISGCNWNPNDFTWTAPSAGTYYVVISPYLSYQGHICNGTASDAFTLLYYTGGACQPPPPNDNCSSVTPQACPVIAQGNNTCATNDAPCLTPPTVQEVWHAFTIDEASRVTVIVCGLSGYWQNFYWIVTQGCPCSSYVLRDTYLYPYPDCDNGGITFTFNNLAAGTYYVPIMRDEVNGAVGPYAVQITCSPVPTGRCCYNGTCEDGLRYGECTALGGIWGHSQTCASDPCAIPAACFEESLTGGLPHPGYAQAHTSDEALYYLVADPYSVSAPISQLRFWGVNGAYQGSGWVSCGENPMPFHIRFHHDNGGLPGAAAAQFTALLNRQEVSMLFYGWPVYQYTFTLPVPVTLLSGWLSVQGTGDPECQFLWAVSDLGAARQRQGLGNWNPLLFAMAYCMAGACDPPQNVVVQRQPGAGGGVNVHFVAPAAGVYKVWRTTVKDHDGDPDNGEDPQWTLLTTVNAAVGETTVTDNAVDTYVNYVVVHDCAP